MFILSLCIKQHLATLCNRVHTRLALMLYFFMAIVYPLLLNKKKAIYCTGHACPVVARCQELLPEDCPTFSNLAHSFQTSWKSIYNTVTCLETVTKMNSQYVPAVVCDVPPASLLISDVILLLICGSVVTVCCKLVRLATIEGLTNE